jgi:hypothetical protein
MLTLSLVSRVRLGYDRCLSDIQKGHGQLLQLTAGHTHQCSVQTLETKIYGCGEERCNDLRETEVQVTQISGIALKFQRKIYTATCFDQYLVIFRLLKVHKIKSQSQLHFCMVRLWSQTLGLIYMYMYISKNVKTGKMCDKCLNGKVLSVFRECTRLNLTYFAK